MIDDGAGDYYFAHDHLFSTVALYGIDGNDNFALAERYEYDAYGKAVVYTNMADWNTANPTTQSYSTIGNGYTFTGRRVGQAGRKIEWCCDHPVG